MPQQNQWTTFDLPLAQFGSVGDDIGTVSKMGDAFDQFTWYTTTGKAEVMIDRFEVLNETAASARQNLVGTWEVRSSAVAGVVYTGEAGKRLTFTADGRVLGSGKDEAVSAVKGVRAPYRLSFVGATRLLEKLAK